jgi:uncharacterized membrane protein
VGFCPTIASTVLLRLLSFEGNVMNRYMTVGLTMLAGAALLEAALIPGVVIGGVAVLAPKYLPKLRRRLLPLTNKGIRPRTVPAALEPIQTDVQAPLPAPAGFAIKQAIAKTITFRIIVTALDFTSNYVVIGELATAAGLSAFAAVAGPVFYLAHEAGWNYFGPSGTNVDVPVLRLDRIAPAAERGRLVIGRALAKTITFRTVATAMDFTTTYVVVGDLATAVGLSAFGFVVGPFIYLGHEMVWDYYSAPRGPASGTADAKPTHLEHEAR